MPQADCQKKGNSGQNAKKGSNDLQSNVGALELFFLLTGKGRYGRLRMQDFLFQKFIILCAKAAKQKQSYCYRDEKDHDQKPQSRSHVFVQRKMEGGKQLT